MTTKTTLTYFSTAPGKESFSHKMIINYIPDIQQIFELLGTGETIAQKMALYSFVPDVKNMLAFLKKSGTIPEKTFYQFLRIIGKVLKKQLEEKIFYFNDGLEVETGKNKK